MGKPDFKSPRPRNILTKSRPISRIKSTPLRSSANIKVVVRVRPPNYKEEGDNSKIIVDIVDDKVLVFDPKVNSQAFFYHGVEQKGRDLLRKANKDMQFMFDRVFGFESSNDEIFQSTTKDLIQNLMDGFNCSVFAYGATGAGKTHTMLGHNSNPGITYLTMAELFKIKSELSNERKFELGITYLEVYNELVQDLLNPGRPLQLRDDGKYGVTVAGIKVYKITKPEELFSLLEQGNNNRTQHPTDANAESSRSHAVFQVYIQMEFKVSREMRTAKLSMIDLAGSERGSATGYGGARFTEGANINKSLLALGNCINSLADGKNYVPYRDSKLTRLLKDSLGGNCQTVMIANVSPSSLSYEDTYNTLKYATRAKKIKSNIKQNVVSKELHVGEYVKIVADLKKENEMLKAQLRERERAITTVNILSPRATTPINVKRNQAVVDTAVTNQLGKIIEDKKRMLERMHNLEVADRMVALRRQLKEEVDSRLSVLTDTPLKGEAHTRLGKSIGRFHRQEEALRAELDEIKANKQQLEVQIKQLKKKYPIMEKQIDLELEKLYSLETRYQVDVMEKKCALLEHEMESRATLLEKSCGMLKSLYLQMRGHGLASDKMINEYQTLVDHLQGRNNITWDDGTDSGMCSSTTSSLTDEENRHSVKRKLSIDVEVDDTGSLHDGTFVMDVKKSPKVKVCAEEIMVKACKQPKKRFDISHPLKENKRIPNSAALKSASSFRKAASNKPEIFKKPPFRT